jgi:flavin reductase (DIM6/NTAB) family NADH-FMN oxidoreductase RutF
MFYRPGARPPALPHDPIKALVSPRPIAWVSTIDNQGEANIAPFSYFNLVHDAPPSVMIAPNAPKRAASGEPGAKPDTLRNILENKEFVVNIVSFADRDAMNMTAKQYAADVDEFDRAALNKTTSELISPPRVDKAVAALECRFLTRVALPSDDENIDVGAIFGAVIGVHIRDDVIKNGLVDVAAYQPLARLGYRDYAVVRETFELSRPDEPRPS